MPSALLADYSQFPNSVIELLPQIKKVASFRLLFLVLRRMNTSGHTRVRISSTEAKILTGLDANRLTDARKELQRLRLLKSTEISHTGEWQYELLNPATGASVASPKTRRDFNNLPPEVILAYFTKRLKEYSPTEHTENQLRAYCPFHLSTKLTVFPLSCSGDGIWHCFRCNKQGHLTDFEMQWAVKTKGSVISKTQAQRNIMAIVSESESEPSQEEFEPVEI